MATRSIWNFVCTSAAISRILASAIDFVGFVVQGIEFAGREIDCVRSHRK